MATEVQSPPKQRPVNLNLMTIHQPMMAVVSILHRLSGVLLFLSIPFLLWVFSLSLNSPDSFALVHSWFAKVLIKCLIWLILSALIYHGIAGIRHFIMDFGIGESLNGGRISAYITLLLSLAFAVFLGVWLW
jgi:succinate dehydrogenase / fumarate reductase cytochrome b subunit